MKETARRLALESATALIASGFSPEETLDQLATWVREWLEDKEQYLRSLKEKPQ